jgi:hypothetical protein
MGMIGKILGGVAGAKLLQGALNRRASQSGRYIPASQADASAGAVASPSSGGLMGRASRFYAENPKMVHTVGAAALAIALASFAKRRGVL